MDFIVVCYLGIQSLQNFYFPQDSSFLDSQGDLQEKPVINGQMTANLKQTTERTVENRKNPINDVHKTNKNAQLITYEDQLGTPYEENTLDR